MTRGTILRSRAKAGLFASGWYARRLARDTFPGVLVLGYHGVRSPSWRTGEAAFPNLHVSEDTFDGHCRVIREMCHPIALADWRAARGGGPSLPARPVLVTFDDGYRSVFDVARPILRRYAIPAAVFICTEPVRRRRLFWFDAVARERGEAAVEQLRALPGARLREALADYPGSAADDDPLAPMTIDQIKTLRDDRFEIGVHTATHAALAAATPEDQRVELAACRAALEEWTGLAVTALAYPWGKPRIDYTEETVAIAARLGFDFAFTTCPDFARPDQPSLERSRFLVLAEVSPAELAHRIAWAWPRS
jgi:peptidoglycan/xylan/chitin deacetylase (PgdA/CDA1 family)